MQTQNDSVLAYMQINGTVDPVKALSELGVFRLAARIKDLRDSGFKINKAMVKVHNRFGEECRIARYKLVQP